VEIVLVISQSGPSRFILIISSKSIYGASTCRVSYSIPDIFGVKGMRTLRNIGFFVKPSGGLAEL
jgi:hypothetical protein